MDDDDDYHQQQKQVWLNLKCIIYILHVIIMKDDDDVNWLMDDDWLIEWLIHSLIDNMYEWFAMF